MLAGLGTRNTAYGPEITTVCYETEKPSRRAYIFERGSLEEPNYCTDVCVTGAPAWHTVSLSETMFVASSDLSNIHKFGEK